MAGSSTIVAGNRAAATPARAGVAAAREADEIIIDTRCFGRARALLGSVAHELIHLADCPVTVIPQRALDRAAVPRQSRGWVMTRRCLRVELSLATATRLVARNSQR